MCKHAQASVSRHYYGVQRSTCWFSPPTFWILGIEVRFSSLKALPETPYLLWWPKSMIMKRIIFPEKSQICIALNQQHQQLRWCQPYTQSTPATSHLSRRKNLVHVGHGRVGLGVGEVLHPLVAPSCLPDPLHHHPPSFLFLHRLASFPRPYSL